MVSSTCACFAYVLMVFYNGQLIGTLDKESMSSCNRSKPTIVNNYKPADRSNLKLVCDKK